VLDEASRAPHARPLGGAARWWLAQSLKALEASLRSAGTVLILRRGAAVKIIGDLAREAEAGAVFWNEIAQAPHQAVADDVAAHLERIGVEARRFPGDLLAAPADIRSKEGRGLRVFTPFWRRVQGLIDHLGGPPAPLPAPKSLPSAPGIASEPLESFRLEPHRPDWAGGLRETWMPGERAAQARLKRFLEHGVKAYAANRDRPDRDGTSGLSPHLRFGEISPRQVWHAARFAAAERPALTADTTSS
jgi:deoxyribodipyrimidine photo-lyase